MRRKTYRKTWTLPAPSFQISKYIFMLLVSISSISCTRTEIIGNNKVNEVPFNPVLSVDSLTFDLLPDSQKKRMLYVDENRSESFDTITDWNLRSFSTQEWLQVRIKDKQSIYIRNWTCNTLYNVSLYAILQDIGANEKFLVAHYDSIPCLGELVYTPRFIREEAMYKTEDGKYLHFILPSLENETLSFVLESDDPFYQKLHKGITVKWNIGFGTYSTGNWSPIKAVYAREWVMMITNLAYMVSTSEMRYIIGHYKEIMGGDLKDNGKNTFTQETYENLYKLMTADRTFHLGLTMIGGGLGGGTTYGVDHWMFYTHYYGNVNAKGSPWEMLTHEFAHCLGYSHDSTLTYGDEYGFATRCVPYLYNHLRKDGRIPYSDPSVFDFANAKYQKYWINGIVRDWMEYNESTSRLDTYFENHPDWNKQAEK